MFHHVFIDYFFLQYVPCNIPGPGTSLVEFKTEFTGCDCKGEELCDSPSCICVKNYGMTYQTGGKLRCEMVAEVAVQKPVFECNKNCHCSSQSCSNRVVQKGLMWKLEVFLTQDKGLGVRTKEHIPQHSFVCEYAGEVLTKAEAKKRIAKHSYTDSNYVFALGEHLASGSVLITYIDPSLKGNVGRFINHSCKPNLYIVPVRIDNNVPRLAMFAGSDISPEEELTYDYAGLCEPEIPDESDDNGGVNIPSTCTSKVENDLAVDACNLQSENLHKTRNKFPYEQSEKSFLVHAESTPTTQRLKPCFCYSGQCRGHLPYDNLLFD